MKIALVYPRTINQFKSNLFPLGIVYLATILEHKNYKVKIFDSSWDEDLDKVKDKIKSFNPNIVGIGVTSDLMEHAKEMINFSKKLDAFTVLGGPHASVAPKSSLEFIEGLDFVVVGEGEETFLELIKELEENKRNYEIKGLAFRKNKEIVINSPRLKLADINELPFPDRDLIPNYDRYLNSGIIGVSLLRGCPFNCKFCQPAERKIFGNKIRFRNPKNIVEEIKLLVEEYGPKEFYISNDLFTMDREWIEQIYKELRQQNLLDKVKFIVLSRVDLFDEELASLLKKMNVIRILFGVESGSQKILDYLNKKTNLRMIKKAFSIAKRYKIKTHALFILGTPLETRKTLLKTSKLIEELEPTQVMFSLFTALPGTYLYEEFKEKNMLSLQTYDQYDFYEFSEFGPNIELQNIKYEELIKFKDNILEKRKKKMLIQNAISFLKDINFKDYKKLISRWKTYQRCKDFFG